VPQAIFIQLATACNAKCINCPYIFTYGEKGTHKKGVMDDNVWIKIVHDLKAMNFTGQVGFYLHHEPLLVNSLFDKVEDINSNTKAFVVISTNGFLLTKEKRKALISSKPRVVHININSGDKAEYELMTGLVFDITIENTKSFIEEAKGKIHIEINCPVLPGVDTDLLKNLFPDVQVNTDYMATSRGGTLTWVYCKSYLNRFNLESYCYQPIINFNILYDGSVILCCNDWLHKTKGLFSKVTESSIFEIYNSELMKKIRAEFKKGDYSRFSMCTYCAKEMGFTITKENDNLASLHKAVSSDLKPVKRVLLTNIRMLDFTGSEIYTMTLAKGLRKSGIDTIVYSKFIGGVIEAELNRAGIPLVNDINKIKEEKFDLIHAHHNINAMELRYHFPDISMVYMSHGVLPALEQPPFIDIGIDLFLAVSEEVRQNLINNGVPEERVLILRNMVDSELFRELRPVNKVPKKVLIFSYKLNEQTILEIKNSCKRLGLACIEAGNWDNPVHYYDLPYLMNDVDIVISSGRGIIEAMLCGRIPLVIDRGYMDGMVTPYNIRELMKCNFSGRRYRINFSRETFESEIEKYNHLYGQELRKISVELFSADYLINRLVQIYIGVLLRREKEKHTRKELPVILEKILSCYSEIINVSSNHGARFHGGSVRYKRVGPSIQLEGHRTNIRIPSGEITSIHSGDNFPQQNAGNLTCPEKKLVHPIAFYLPQYHPIPENDNWWGEGFTEWTNVRSAVPLFEGHIQPRIPTELGWYDLHDLDVIKKQVEFAREHGIYGFCFYHYWFNGKLLLEKPLENFLNCSEIDFPFCLCWANEDWTRAWDGRSGEVLIKQEYSAEDDLSHIRYLIPFLKDERYIKVDGKPLLLVYRISKLPDPLKTTEVWREEAKKAGIGELFLCSVENFPEDRRDPRHFGFDASIEFQPDFVNLGNPLPPEKYNGVRVYDYRQVVAEMLRKEPADYPRFFCVFPQWDNTPRRKKDGLAIINSNPDTYGYWLAESIRRTLKAFPEGRRLVFINAWNEWGEGNMLEPDSVWGRRYLEVTKKAVSDYEKFDPLQEKLEQIERLSENGELEEAKKLALSLIEDHPYHPMLLNELAGIFYREGDKTNAMIYLKKAAALKPDDILILKNLGNIYIELGKNVEAEKMFEKVITIDPEDSESQQILSFLRHEHEKKDVNKPLVSIVIPVLNNLDFTIRCIDSILKCETEIHYEVIIVDNGFTDEIMDYFTSLKNPSVRYVQYEENLGPVGSCNKAVEEAQGDFIFLLVPEIQPRGDWLKPMLELVSENRATAVTSKIVGHDERIVEAGFSVFEKEKLVGNGEGHNKNESQYNHACNAKSGSRYSIFISKKDWIESGGLDSRYSSIHIALVDMGLNLISMGKQILYQPQSEFSIQVTGKEELGKRRPQILFDFSNQVENETRSKVLVLGVYLAEQLNFIEDIVERFAESKNHDVEQYWISIGSERVDKKVQEVTVKVVYDRTPKFVLMNELLSQKNLSEYEYIIIADDDIILPYGFLDEFLHLQSKYEFVLAQPARTTNSYIDHPIVMQQRGVIARQTKFVEIGPLFSVHNSIYDFIFPFDTISPMGWGYENYWSYELSRRGYKMGIIDNTPVDHSIRKPVKNYEWSEADRQRRIYLQKYPHLKYEDCFVVTDVISLRG